jgi:hypothetical protein
VRVLHIIGSCLDDVLPKNAERNSLVWSRSCRKQYALCKPEPSCKCLEVLISACVVILVSTQATQGFKRSNMLESWANVLGANRDNTDLVLELVQFGRIKSRAVAEVMRKV